MKFFADTADTAEIADLAAAGLLDGVTTNPSLIMKSGRDFIEVTREICGLTNGPVSAEVVSLDHAGMMREAEKLRQIADNVCIKVPLTIDGLKTCRAIKNLPLPEGAMPKVVLITNLGGSSDRSKGMLAGCDAYLFKPFKLDDLRAAMAADS